MQVVVHLLSDDLSQCVTDHTRQRHLSVGQRHILVFLPEGEHDVSSLLSWPYTLLQRRNLCVYVFVCICVYVCDCLSVCLLV